MNIKVFSFSRPALSSWRMSSDGIEREIKAWLTTNPSIKVRDIRHDSFQGLWMPPQLIVSIYYAEAGE